ncbi:MAG: zinc metalloprotease HtpX [Candidatus Buchananbacteria bacterium RIFCSPHIGHO2_01_FULL_47_11b]|uniref:Protease HtpX homolog n=1 Tax=Candidatus Buchananbacteria bacterium RIFCSPHIGHO2_01_FULL_47_11b TaxID=1797537 RepID=A0A1G1Y237_9BACT|nr:MAG: zinc metalloprotease HtpX [Candidatus Buchananbacteria bacterium RIFCSPHIGHO2_01_FULL_47_11b]
MYQQIEHNKRKTALLMVTFIVVILLVGYAFAELTDAGVGALAIAAVFSTVMALVSFYQGDRIALATAGAQGPIRSIDNPYLYRLVENLSITAGLPLPKVYVISDPAINAFATGRDPAHASIAVTTGAIEKLENEELEGVLAHELSHIKNYDIRLMMVVLVLIGLVALLSDWFIRIQWFGGSNRRSDSGGGRLQAILLLVGVIMLILAPIIGKLIQLAISRKREFLADASGSLLTRYPEGLARALEKIAEENMALRNANNATAHLFISSPFGRTKHTLSKLFATHPPIDQRIKTLRSMT